MTEQRPEGAVHYKTFVPGKTTGGSTDMRTTYVRADVTCEMCKEMLAQGQAL